jgi:chromosome segregation ATPase
MDEKLKEEIKAAVASIFSEKEEADMRKKTEDALQRSAETIQELTASLEAKNEELDQKNEKIVEADEKAQTLQAELEAAKQEVKDVTDKLTAASVELEKIKKDIAAEKRMVELKEAKIADLNEASQLEKVREMTDEEFASYKAERIALREAVVAEIKAAMEKDQATEVETKAKAEAEAAAAKAEAEAKAKAEAAAAGSEENTSEDDKGTPPANITPGHAVSAALNMEIIPSKDVINKYAELGKALAETMTKSK